MVDIGVIPHNGYINNSLHLARKYLTIIHRTEVDVNTPYSKTATRLVFFCLLANLPLLNFEFKNEAARAYFASKQKNTKMAAILEKKCILLR